MGNVKNQTGVEALQAKAKVTKLKLQSLPGVTDFDGKIKEDRSNIKTVAV